MQDSSKRSPSQIAELLRSGGGIRGVKLILCVALFTVAAVAQSSTSYRIDTFAGTRAVRDNGPAVNARLWEPQGVAVDGAGNLFIADSFNDRIRKVDSAGVITTVAGTGRTGFGGDGGPAVQAQLRGPAGVAVDGAGNLFIADSFNDRIRKVDSAGVITTVAGTGRTGFGGDGGPAVNARLSRPSGVAVDGAGNLFIADSGNDRIRKMDASGTITTVAGTGEFGFSGDGGPATSARLSGAEGVAVDGAGNLFIADEGNDRIRKVDSAGVITTVAGTGEFGFSGDGGPATSARLNRPNDVAVDGAGNVFIADLDNYRIRKVDSAGVITTVAGTGVRGYSGDGGPAVDAQLWSPSRVAVDGAGNLFFADSGNDRIRKVDSAGVITTVAGTEDRGDGGPAVNARLYRPSGVAVDGAGNAFIADSFNDRIRKVDATGTISTVAGTGRTGFGGDGGPAVNARLYRPSGVAVDGVGNVFIADSFNDRIRKVDATGTISTVAGTGRTGFGGGDGGPAVQARLSHPNDVAVDGAGNLFIADSFNDRIRKVDATGTISTVAGTGRSGFGGDGGPAVNARLSRPSGVAVDGAGNLFIADMDNNRIRKVDASGTISTVAGTGEGRFGGFSGDGGPAVQAQLHGPRGVAVDGAGNVFIADRDNYRIRKVDSAGVITTVAGTGVRGYSGDGGPASQAQLSNPEGVAVDGADNLFIADSGNDRIRKLTPVSGSGTSPAGESFSFPDLGGWSTTSSGMEETVRVGYGRISAGVGSTTPSGIAIFQYRDSQGVLIAEASVPATELIQEGRIFAEVEGPVNTGLAIANPNDVPATIRFYFTDTTGTNLGSGNFELGEHEQTAKFLNQEPFNEALPDGSPVLGTFTFESSVPIAVIALRGFTNEAGEFLITTLPVAPLSPASEETVYIPHFAAGGGWVTQVILVNPTDSTIAGTVGFLGPGSGTAAASPVILTLDDGSTGSDFDYSIPPRSSQRFTTANPFGALNTGSVRAVPDSGNAAPSGLVVFSYAPAGKTLSEAGVPALPKGSAFRVYAEASGMLGQMGSISTGLAVTNVGDASNTVTLEVAHLDGSLAAAPEMLTLPPSGQAARFLNDIFSLPDNFSGVLRVTSTADIAIVALRLRVNENGEIKVTTLAPSNEMDPPTSENRFFAHLADSGGWSTQFILFSGTAGQAASGTLSFIDTAGQPWDLTTDSGVSGSVPPSGGAYADLVLASASVSSATPMAGQPFELRANVDNRGTGASTATTLRFYRSIDTTISSIDTEVGTDAVSALAAGGTSSSVLMLTALSTAGTYYYGACVDPVSGESNSQNNCSSAVRVTVSASQMEIEGFDLDNENGSPEGIAFANNRFYVVDWFGHQVYAYQATGQRDSASDFDLDSATGWARGIAFANNRFYVVDWSRKEVYAYQATGQRDSASDFDLDSDNDWSGGITFANDRFYVADKFDVKVYAYQATGQRDLASDFDLDPDNEWPSGITFANDRFYVVDDEDDKVYAYQATGQRDSATDFDLNPDNDDARGITFANDRFYVVDEEDYKVYAYSADVPPLGFSESGSATRSIPENLPGGINVGIPVSAAGGDALAYSIGGVDAQSFDIVTETGQIRTKDGVAYDYETKNRYLVEVTVADDADNRESIDVTIDLLDLTPICNPAGYLRLRLNSTDRRLTARWNALPDTTGYARVLGYQTEIRRGSTGPWTDRRTFLGRNITGAVYGGLINEVGYQVRVRSVNAEGDCGWSTPVSGIPTGDLAPRDEIEHVDRFGPHPIGTDERNFRLLTPGRCRHTAAGVNLDADCNYERTSPDTGRITLEFDDPSRGSCDVTLAYSSLTAGSFIDECFDAGVNTNVPFDRSFRMPRLAPRTEDDLDPPTPETATQRAPRTQEEFDELVFGRDDFIPGLCFGSCIFGDPPEKGVARVFRFDEDESVGEYYGDYAYQRTGPDQGVVTLTMRGGGVWTFTLDFEPWGNVRATIVDSGGGTAVWPGTPHVDLALGVQPILLPIPPSWSAAIAIEADYARVESHASDIENELLKRFFPDLTNLISGDGGINYRRERAGLGRNRFAFVVSFPRLDTNQVYGGNSNRKLALNGSEWTFVVTITSDGGAEFSLTVTKEGELPLTGEGFVDFTGDGIDLDEFPEELLLPDEPPQASGEDVSGVEVAAAITASRIGPDDQQVLLVSAAGGNYQPGDWLEPKDGGNQRMMIVSAGPPTSVAASVLAPRSYSSNGMALAASAPQFYARGGSVAADFKTQADLAPYMISGFNAAGTVQLDTVVSAAGDGGFVQLNVVCMQFEHDIPTRGARYFSVANAAEGPVETCQKQCVLDESANIQSCVWQCGQ